MVARPQVTVRDRRWPVLLVAAAALLSAILVLQQRVGAATGAPTGSCDGPTPRSAAGFQRMFDSLDGAWAGGDQAATVALPHGRTLWLFGDTVAGRRDASGGYAPGWTYRHNSFLVEDAGCLRDLETRLPETPDTWYWPAAAVVDGGRLEVFAMRVVRTTSDFGFRETGMALADYDLAADGTPTLHALRPLAAQPRDSGQDTAWGQGVLSSGGYLYLYGTRADTVHGAFGRALLVARAPVGAVADQPAWRYFDGVRFAAGAAHARPVVAALQGVSTSVTPVGTATGVAVVSKQDEVFGSTVAVWTAPSPAGPFSARPVLAAPSDLPHKILRYSALAHPQFALADGGLLVSVCRNSTDLARIGRDALLYRPQFYSVPMPG